MKARKHIVRFSGLFLIVGIIVSASVISFLPKPITGISTYEMEFQSGQPSAIEKNEYLAHLKSNLKKVLDDYEKELNLKNQKFDGLTLNYTNLTRAASQGNKDFFFMLDRTLKSLDSRLSFNNLPRTPVSVQEGFYNKNTDMLTFYWSPDYNGIGTWIKYMFSAEFSMPNYWPGLFAKLEANDKLPIQNQIGWLTSLKKFLHNYTYGTIAGKNLLLDELSGIDIVAVSNQPKEVNKTGNLNANAMYVRLVNVIASWTEINSKVEILIPGDSATPAVFNSPKLVDISSESSYGIQLINYISSTAPNIPNVEDGGQTSIPWLIRDGFYNPIDPNSSDVYRDWFYDVDTVGKTENVNFRIWIQDDPLQSNKTPYNPAYSNTASPQFKSAWTALTAWTTVGSGDILQLKENQANQPEAKGPFLVSAGSTTTIKSMKDQFNKDKKIEFKVRPIPWINYRGEIDKDKNGVEQFLSPQDFLAAIQGFLRSVDNKLNSNGYFLDLLDLDLEKTLNLPANNDRNTNKSETKTFTLFFNNPTLNINYILDVLQKQYFNAIPAYKQTVINITDDAAYNKVAVVSEHGALDTLATDMNQFYGSGDSYSGWTDYVSTGPYYISKLTKQQIHFSKNEQYFKSFENPAWPGINDLNGHYNSFLDSWKINGREYQKIDTVIINYAGSFSDTITYEQFKSNELDVALIQAAKLSETLKSQTKNVRFRKTEKINKSDIIGYNLQVYETTNNTRFENIINDSNGAPMWDEKTQSPSYTSDQFGNLDFNGKTPRIKSLVSPEYYDLIVKDYYTPAEYIDDQGNVQLGKSATIREAINNLINWVSMKDLIFPGITKSVQYSFMPYGVFDLSNVQNDEFIMKYWDLVSNKKYLTKTQQDDWNDDLIKQRKAGISIWSYDEMINNIISMKGKD